MGRAFFLNGDGSSSFSPEAACLKLDLCISCKGPWAQDHPHCALLSASQPLPILRGPSPGMLRHQDPTVADCLTVQLAVLKPKRLRRAGKAGIAEAHRVKLTLLHSTPTRGQCFLPAEGQLGLLTGGWDGEQALCQGKPQDPGSALLPLSFWWQYPGQYDNARSCFCASCQMAWPKPFPLCTYRPHFHCPQYFVA